MKPAVSALLFFFCLTVGPTKALARLGGQPSRGHFLCAALLSRLFGNNDDIKLESARRKWSPTNFSDPKLHNAGTFRYIVHGIGPHSRFFGELVRDPQLLARNNMISASLIDEHHRTIFGGYMAFILKVPPENIFAAYNDDIGLPNTFTFGRLSSNKLEARRELLKYYDAYGIRTPDWVLENTPILRDRYNELAIMGTVGSGQIEVIGIVASKNLAEKYLELLSESAAKHGLPMVFLDK